ncbi:MAG: hypothetical protein GEU98_23040 [Pseudonocardiaceae bacterium]|nr:hypothetical protein [Pseudonocardiaceae bacterium]
MIEPTGPLPPSVYWRRRVVAAVGSVLALLLIVWLLSSGSDESVAPTGGKDEGIAASAPPPSTSSTSSSSSATSSTSPSPTSSGHPVPSSGKPPESSRTSPRKPEPPRACADEVLKLVVRLGKPAYRVGERPRLSMVLTNAGPEPCVKNVSRQLRELVVTTMDRRNRIWSSLDCYPPTTNERPVLRPGQQLRFDLRWAGRTSEPGCPIERQVVPAGEYLVTGKIGKSISAPARLRLM